MEDLMDIKRTEKIWELVKDGLINLEKVTTNLPSPFALNLMLQGHTDLMRIEDKIEFLKRMHNEVMGKIVKDKEGKGK